MSSVKRKRVAAQRQARGFIPKPKKIRRRTDRLFDAIIEAYHSSGEFNVHDILTAHRAGKELIVLSNRSCGKNALIKALSPLKPTVVSSQPATSPDARVLWPAQIYSELVHPDEIVDKQLYREAQRIYEQAKARIIAKLEKESHGIG